MGEEGGFDFGGYDVFAAADDEVATPLEDPEVTVVVEAAQVAGVQPAIAQSAGRFLRLIVVAAHDGGAAHEDLAHGAGRQRLAIVAGNAHVGEEEGAAAGSRLAPGLLRRRGGDLGGGFGEAVGGGDGQIQLAALLQEGRGRGGAAEEDAAQGRREGPAVAGGEKAVEHGGHEGDDGYAAAVKGVVHSVDVEAGVEVDGCSVEAGAEDDGQPADVVEGHGRQPAVAGGEAEAEGGGDGAEVMVGVGEHGGPRLACGAGGEGEGLERS